MAHQFSLLLYAVSCKRPVRLEPVTVSAKRVAHKQKPEAAMLLGLPNMDKFMDKQALQAKRRLGKIVAVILAGRMEMDMTHRCHDRTARLQWEEPPPPDAHRSEFNCIAEHHAGKGKFSLG